MIKLIEVVGRRADLTHSQFIKHLSTTHLEVVDRVPEFRNRVRRYMQNHLFTDCAPIKGAPISFRSDAIIEVWWDSVSDIIGAFEEPRYLEIIRPDELSFGDVPGAWGVTSSENVIMGRDGFSGRMKWFLFLKRGEGISHSEFMSRWRQARDNRLMAASVFRKRVGAFVENVVAQDPARSLPGMRAFDVIAELWLESFDDVTELNADADVLAVIQGGNAEYIDQSQTLVYIAEEQPASAAWLQRHGSSV